MFGAALVIFLVLAVVFVAASNFVGTVFGIDEVINIENSEHFTHNAGDARANYWLTRELSPELLRASTLQDTAYNLHSDNVEGIVSATAIKARANFIDAKYVVLVPESTCDAASLPVLNCADFSALPSAKLTSRQAEILRMQYVAARVLASNKALPCVCGPMLGFPYRYIGVSVVDKSAASEMSVLHMFNPSLESAELYDQLNAKELKAQNIGLKVRKLSQDWRYNVSRGSFDVILQTSLAIDYDDKDCRQLRYKETQFSDRTSCLQQCIDLVNGIDVRERARMQYKSGIMFNKKYFIAASGGDHGVSTDLPSCTFRLQNDTRVGTMHDEL